MQAHPITLPTNYTRIIQSPSIHILQGIAGIQFDPILNPQDRARTCQILSNQEQPHLQEVQTNAGPCNTVLILENLIDLVQVMLDKALASSSLVCLEQIRAS